MYTRTSYWHRLWLDPSPPFEHMPRFYAHFQDVSEHDEDQTVIVEMPHAATVAQLTAECCRRYNAREQLDDIDQAALQVTVAGKALPLNPEDTLAQRVKNGSDVLLSLLDHGDKAVSGNEALPEAPKAAAKQDTVALQSPGVLQYLQESLEDSTKAMQAKNFRGACELHEKIFAIDPTNMQACYQQALVELSISAYSNASATLERALTARPPPQEPEIYVKLGEAYHGQGGMQNYQTALQHYDTALGLASSSPAYDEDRTDNIKVLMAETLQKAENADVALQLVTSVLQRNEQHTDALVLYGAMMSERYVEFTTLCIVPLRLRAYGAAVWCRGQRDEALRVYLRLLVSQSENKVVREAFSTVLQTEGAMEVLRDDLQEGETAAPAYTFLASIVKDYGAIAEATELYSIATRIIPTNPNSTLSYVHTLELSCKYEVAMERINDFAAQNPKVRAGRASGSAVAQIFERLGRIKRSGSSFLHPWKDGKPVPRLSVAPAGAADRAPKKSQESLSPDSLDFLALLFTACKIAYVTGDLELLVPLIELLVSETDGRELHKTLIRNEAAYFGCVRELVGMLPLPESVRSFEDSREDATKQPPIYVVGDSHSLSCGWHTIKDHNGQHRILRPMLVTGLKCWHMRPESRFYPKINLHNVLAQIPRGADVLFIFGEIDCREGLLVSVERCRYKDVDEGIAVTVDIYVQKLVEIQKKYDFKILVHPVPPVLDLTRDVVKRFNRVCQAKVNAAQHSSIQYLDFAHKLIDADGGLVEGLGYDGTHLHPRYLTLLEGAVSAL